MRSSVTRHVVDQRVVLRVIVGVAHRQIEEREVAEGGARRRRRRGRIEQPADRFRGEGILWPAPMLSAGRETQRLREVLLMDAENRTVDHPAVEALDEQPPLVPDLEDFGPGHRMGQHATRHDHQRMFVVDQRLLAPSRHLQDVRRRRAGPLARQRHAALRQAAEGDLSLHAGERRRIARGVRQPLLARERIHDRDELGIAQHPVVGREHAGRLVRCLALGDAGDRAGAVATHVEQEPGDVVAGDAVLVHHPLERRVLLQEAAEEGARRRIAERPLAVGAPAVVSRAEGADRQRQRNLTAGGDPLR